MSRNKKILAGVIALFLMLVIVVGVVVFLLHGRNSVEESSTMVEPTTLYVPTEEETVVSTVAFEDKFGDNLSDNVGKVIISTWMNKSDVNRALNALVGVFSNGSENMAIYVRSVDIDKEEFTENVVYSVYQDGNVEQGVIEVSEDNTDYWSSVFLNIVYEEYRDQVNAYK